jgi:oligosaccharide repeat unit polymerase
MSLFYIFILISLSFFFFFVLNKTIKSSDFGLRFDGLLIFLIVFYFHSISLPVSRLLFRSESKDSDFFFILTLILAWLGIFTSSFFVKRKKVDLKEHKERFNYILLYLLLLSIAYWNFYVMLSKLNFSLINILLPYGAENEIGNFDDSILDSVREMLLYSIVGFGYIVGDKNKLKKLKLLSLLIAYIYVIFILLRGSRNAALMILLPLVFYYMRNKQFKIFRVGIFAIFFYFIGYFIGIVRSFGFSEISGINVDVFSFDPLSQEFGTSYSVYSKWLEINSNFDFQFGKTYLVDPILHFIPSSLWPDRPPSVALQFSMNYFGVTKVSDLNSGLGFSPLLEAHINFGYFGVFLIFFIVFLLFVKIISYFYQKQSVSYYLMNGFFCVFALNFTRIDFAIVFKIYLIFVLVTIFLNRLLKA